jgi:hypothetical protein
MEHPGRAAFGHGCERSAFFRATPPGRHVLFTGIVISVSGGPSSRAAAGRTGSVRVLLERNPPNRPLVSAGTPALGETAIPLLKIKKRNYMPSKTAQPVSSAKPTTSAKLPVKTFRLGRIKAAVWENEADQKKFYNVTFARTYVDDAKNYHDTDSFGRDDLPLVAKLADQAHTFIFDRLAELKSEQSE